MRIRSVLGIITGMLGLWVVFYSLLLAVALAWPALRDVGTQVMENRDYSGLALPMLLFFLGDWYLSYLASGWMTVKITRRLNHVWIMALPFFLFAVWNHLYAMWVLFPPWYNGAVVVGVYPLVMLGGNFGLSKGD